MSPHLISMCPGLSSESHLISTYVSRIDQISVYQSVSTVDQYMSTVNQFVNG